MKQRILKVLSIVLFLGSSIQLLAQQENEILFAQNDYLDKSFMLCRISLGAYPLEEQKKINEIHGNYLIILPPVFETRKKTIQIPIQPFYEKTSSSAKEILIDYRYEYIEGYVKPRMLNEMPDKGCLSVASSECMTIDFEKIPALTTSFTRKIKKSDYENDKIEKTIEFTFDYHYLAKAAQVIKTPFFNPFNYNGLSNIKLHYLIGNNWSEIREVYCGADDDANYPKCVQLALRDKGYEIEISNIFDEATKKALVDFQKKNGLPIGKLDEKTLEQLGADKYIEEIIKVYDGYNYLNSPRFDY